MGQRGTVSIRKAATCPCGPTGPRRNDRRLSQTLDNSNEPRGLREKHTVTRLIIFVQTVSGVFQLNVRDPLQRRLSESIKIYGIFMGDKRLSVLIKACRNRKLSGTDSANQRLCQPPCSPQAILILKFRCRRIAFLRDHYSDYDVSCHSRHRVPSSPVAFPEITSVIAVARHNFNPQSFPPDDYFLLAPIPGYPDTTQVELPNDIWPFVSTVVHAVTIVIRSGASSLARAHWPLLCPFLKVRDAGLTSGFGVRFHGSLPCKHPPETACNRSSIDQFPSRHRNRPSFLQD